MARTEQGTGALEQRLVPVVDLSPAPGTPADGAVGALPGGRAAGGDGATAGDRPDGSPVNAAVGGPVDGRVDVPARVELRLPADPAYLSVLRTTAASLATRLDVTVDDVEDVRMAVDEAASLVLGGTTTTGAVLEAFFDLDGPRLVVEVRGPATTLPDRGSVAWALLDALVGGLEVLGTSTGSALRLVHDTAGGPR